MNRATALLLAMATLLAHTLAVHLDAAQRFGPPYESAHVAYRLARNLAREGVLAWNVGLEGSTAGGLGSYPSPLWVGVAALAELRWIPVNLFTQTIGVAAALATVAMSARFATDRIGGVIPAVLLVTSGSFAAAAGSGTELSTAALLLTTAFVAFEHRRAVWLAATLAVLAATRPEASFMIVGFALLAGLERRVPRRDGAPAMPLWVFAPPALVLAVLLARETGAAQRPYLDLLVRVAHGGAGQLGDGLRYLADFAVGTVFPLLAVFPLFALAVRRLSGAGLRGLALAALWATLVALEGGGERTFTISMVPALPLIAIAVQQGVLAALDTGWRTLERLSWGALLAAVLLSGLASKFPGDLGPLPVSGVHQDWMTGRSPAPFGREPWLGRGSLQQELRVTQELRDLGAFLRRHAEPEWSLLTPWPGALGYLSRMRVFDLFGRVTAPAPELSRPSWQVRPERVDVIAGLELAPDFVHLGRASRRTLLGRDEDLSLVQVLMQLDAEGTPRRAERLRDLLAGYELVAFPVGVDRPGARTDVRVFYLLRKRALELAPRLVVRVSEGRIVVEAHAPRDSEGDVIGCPQLARLVLKVRDSEGRTWYVDPWGELVEDSRVANRIGIEIVPTGSGVVRLADLELPAVPDGASLREVSAGLFNPGLSRRLELAPVAEEVVVEIR